MKIDEQLNLVLPVRSDDQGVVIYAYHTPISKRVFEQNYRIISAANSYLYSKGGHFLLGSGPRIASLTLKDMAREDAAARGRVDGNGEGSEEQALALLQEIKRLTVILSPTANGFEQLPVDVAIRNGVIDAEEWEEAESELVFFTFFVFLTPKLNREGMMNTVYMRLRASNTPLSPTEYASSLPTSTVPAVTVSKAASSVLS
jgi:hypothetical protein